MPGARTDAPKSLAGDMIAIDAEALVESQADTVDAASAAPGPVKTAAPRTASGGHPFRHHEISLGDGKLVLDRDGSIKHVGPDGEVTATWQPDDPEWSRYALRFGLQPGGGGNAVPLRPPQQPKRPRD